jgi:hypothetical protein
MNDRVVMNELIRKALILRGLFKGLDDLSLADLRSAEIASAMVQAGLPVIEQLADDLCALSDQQTAA